MGAALGRLVGFEEGLLVGSREGEADVGRSEGEALGRPVGLLEGAIVTAIDGEEVTPLPQNVTVLL